MLYQAGSKKKDKRDQSNFVERREEERLLMSFHAMKVADQDVWVVDSGCSNHMTGCKEFFSTLDENFHTISRQQFNSPSDGERNRRYQD